MRARLIEAFDAAMGAEKMVGCPAAEAVADNASRPVTSSKTACGTMTWTKPVIRHTEQLQSSAATGGSPSSAANLIAPQWHPPVTRIATD
jgi:hypothetical protein